MDKEKLRQSFGKFGDRKEFLERMFGSAYLDYRDDSQDNIPSNLQEFAESRGYEVANVGPLVGRAIEQAQEISCEENQTILLKHLKGYIGGDPDTTFEEITSTAKHKQTCTNGKCRRIDFIATLDNQLTPEEMKASFGKEIETWEIN